MSPAASAATTTGPERPRGPWGSVLFLVVFTVYAVTVAPSVLSSDSAEFQYVAWVWGLPHPTGYPTYVYLSKLFTLLPFGEVAWRVNLLSVTFAALSAVVLFRLALLLGARALPAAAGALCLAFGGTYGSLAVVAEVHTLNTFFLGLLLILAVRLGRAYSDRDLAAWAVVAALAMGNHASATILLPVIACLFARPSVVRARWPRFAAAFAGFVLLVAALYAYVPLRSARMGLADLFDARVLSGLWRYMSGGRFGERMFAYGLAEQPGRLAYGLDRVCAEVGWIGLPLFVLGFFRVRPLRERLPILAMGLVITVYAMNYGVGDSEVFFVPAHFAFAVFLALGLDGAWAWASGRPLAVQRATAALVFLFPLGLLAANHDANDKSGDYADGTWGRGVLASLEPDARICLSWERRCTLLYLQLVEGLRPDVDVQRIAGFEDRLGELARTRPTYVLDEEDRPKRVRGRGD